MTEFPIPDNLRVQIAESSPSKEGRAFSLADDMAYAGQHQLSDLVKPDMRVTIAFTDATRACPDERLVECWNCSTMFTVRKGDE